MPFWLHHHTKTVHPSRHVVLMEMCRSRRKPQSRNPRYPNGPRLVSGTTSADLPPSSTRARAYSIGAMTGTYASAMGLRELQQPPLLHRH